MGKKNSYPLDENSFNLVERYEQYLAGKASGYFDVEEFEKIVDYYLMNTQNSKAKKALELALKLHPANNTLFAKRAKIHLLLGDPVKALSILNGLAITDDYEVNLLKIDALLKTGKNNDAIAITEKIVASESEDIDLIMTDISSLYIGNNELETALYFLKKGHELSPLNADILYEIAFCYEQKDDLKHSEETYQQIIKIDPFSYEAWFNLGQVFFTNKEYRKAIQAYDYALAISEDDSMSILQRAHCYFHIREYKKAIDEYVEYSELTGEKFESYMFIAESYEKMDQFDLALDYYHRSHTLSPESFNALEGIIVCLLELEKFHESFSYIYKAIGIDKKSSEIYIYLAEAFTGITDYDNALKAYLKSLSIEPVQPETVMTVGNLYMDKKDFATALKYYETAMELDSNLELLCLFIAIAYYKTKKYQKALKYLHIASLLYPEAISLFMEFCPESKNFIAKHHLSFSNQM